MTQRKRTRRSFGYIRRLPSGRYQASYVGPDTRTHLAPHTFAAKIDAEGWLAARRRDIDRDLWSAPATEAETTAKRTRSVTFGQFAETWLDTRTVKGRPLRPRTRQHYRTLLDRHLLPTFAAVPLRNITPESVDRWYAVTAADTPTLRAHCYSLLRTILESARTGRTRYIDTNPCMIDGATQTPRKSRTRIATPDELATIADTMPERYRAMILLGAWCAMRYGELIELRRKDVDLDANLIRIDRAASRVGDGTWSTGDPKTDAGIRTVAIPPHIRAALEHHLDRHTAKPVAAQLFPPTNGDYLQPSTFYRHFYRAREAAGRPDLRFHDLRHTGATYAAQAGATLAELMNRLGHTTPAAALRYQHAADGRDQQLAARLSELAEGHA